MLSEIIVFRSQTEAMPTDIFLSIANIIRSLSRIFSLILITSENFVREKESDDSCTGLNNETGRCDYLRRCFYHEYDLNFTLAVIHSCTIGKA